MTLVIGGFLSGTAWAADPNTSQRNLEEDILVRALQYPQDSRGEGHIPLTSGASQLLHQQIWDGRIKALKANPENTQRDRLYRLIDQVRSVRLEPRIRKPCKDLQGHSAQAPLSSEPSGDEPNEVNVDDQVIPNSRKPETQVPQAREGEFSEQTLKAVQAVIKKKPSIKNNRELAQALFAGGYVQEAATFYRKAYELVDTNGPAAVPERAWLLFQIGNCLREVQPQEAVQAYHQLRADYPDSPWSALAGPWQDLAQWYAAENPQGLLQELESQRMDKALQALPDNTETLFLSEDMNEAAVQ